MFTSSISQIFVNTCLFRIWCQQHVWHKMKKGKRRTEIVAAWNIWFIGNRWSHHDTTTWVLKGASSKGSQARMERGSPLNQTQGHYFGNTKTNHVCFDQRSSLRLSLISSWDESSRSCVVQCWQDGWGHSRGCRRYGKGGSTHSLVGCQCSVRKEISK